MTPKTFSDLCKEATKLAEDRIKSESPGIRDTQRRRFEVYKTELAALVVASNMPLKDFDIREEAEFFAYGYPTARSFDEKVPPERVNPDDIIKKFAETDVI